MQKMRQDSYFVPINPVTLFSKEAKWSSKYSPWVYVCLKFNYNYYTQRNLNKTIKIDYSELTELFQTRRETLSRACASLAKNNLLVRQNKQNSYTFKDDMEVFNQDKDNFVQIHNNFFIKLLEAGLSVRQLKIYYYLIYLTFHLEAKDGYKRSDQTQTSLVKSLGTRGEEVKAAVDGLIKFGLVRKGYKGQLIVREQFGDLNEFFNPDEFVALYDNKSYFKDKKKRYYYYKNEDFKTNRIYLKSKAECNERHKELFEKRTHASDKDFKTMSWEMDRLKKEYELLKHLEEIEKDATENTENKDNDESWNDTW